jgi:hypothetical protein
MIPNLSLLLVARPILIILALFGVNFVPSFLMWSNLGQLGQKHHKFCPPWPTDQILLTFVTHYSYFVPLAPAGPILVNLVKHDQQCVCYHGIFFPIDIASVQILVVRAGNGITS